MRKLIYLFGFMAIMILPTNSWSHCEIPCGIYDDSTRYVLLLEDITTIEKSMNSINTLSAEEDINYNQLVRWIDNKEEHANKIMEIVTQYFLNQRVVPKTSDEGETYNKYVKMLTQFHQMLVYAMKCKQTTDLENVTKLRELVAESRATYFESQEHSH
ncbi:MAG: superoxide dismutase [Ni] [bacterium]